jgi:hypothetical protein
MGVTLAPLVELPVTGAVAAPIAVPAALPSACRMLEVCARWLTITAITASPISDPKIATIAPVPPLLSAILCFLIEAVNMPA